jgi:glucose uptake protein
MVAAIWGVFVWKEFKGASKNTYVMIGVMFCLFISGLALLVVSIAMK